MVPPAPVVEEAQEVTVKHIVVPGSEKVFKCKSMNKDSVKELISEFDDLPYSFLKSKELLAKRQEKLDTLIWWYEDLRCANLDTIILMRLESGEGNGLTMDYGKLMERLLKYRELNANDIYSLLIPRAGADLSKFKATVASPVPVLGDASVFFYLFMEYRKTVNPTALIFVSFLHSQHERTSNVQDVCARECVRCETVQVRSCSTRSNQVGLEFGHIVLEIVAHIHSSVTLSSRKPI